MCNHTRLIIFAGGDDDTNTEVSVLEDTLDKAGNTWELTRYANAEHGFTDYHSGEWYTDTLIKMCLFFFLDAYDAWADQRSWEATKTFLSELFVEVEYITNEPETYDVTPIDYQDVEGEEVVDLRGYLSLPEGYDYYTNEYLPLVVVFHDGDGVNTYEKKRATMLADLGYIAFAADIYGVDLQGITDPNIMNQQLLKYSTNQELYVQRMQRAIDVASSIEGVNVDVEKVAIIGYCFGGSGVV